LKSVLAREGLSGMIPLEQEVMIVRKQKEATKKNFAEGLGMAIQGKRVKVQNGMEGNLISKNLLLILNDREDFFDQNP